MILYALKYHEKYLRDKGNQGIELLDLAHASVFSQKEEALDLRQKFTAGDTVLLELSLTEKEIPW